MQVRIARAQLASYTPVPGPETPPAYSYTDRLEQTPGKDLVEIREQGFKDLTKMGRQTAHAAVGSAASRGAAFGIGIVAAVRCFSGEVPTGLMMGALAGGLYLAHRGLENREQDLKEQTKEQVQFLRDLDGAQEKLTGVPASPWLFI